MITKCEIYFHDLNAVAQARVLYCAGKINESDLGKPMHTLYFENTPYVPGVGDYVEAMDPPDNLSAWDFGFNGTVFKVCNEEGYATVVDQDDRSFDIDFIYLKKAG